MVKTKFGKHNDDNKNLYPVGIHFIKRRESNERKQVVESN